MRFKASVLHELYNNIIAIIIILVYKMILLLYNIISIIINHMTYNTSDTNSCLRTSIDIEDNKEYRYTFVVHVLCALCERVVCMLRVWWVCCVRAARMLCGLCVCRYCCEYFVCVLCAGSCYLLCVHMCLRVCACVFVRVCASMCMCVKINIHYLKIRCWNG